MTERYVSGIQSGKVIVSTLFLCVLWLWVKWKDNYIFTEMLHILSACAIFTLML